MNGSLKATALAAGTILLLLGPANANPGGGSSWREPSRSFDLTAAAHPVSPRTSRTDQAFDVSTARSRTVSSHVSAIASTGCDGCHGDAATLQVLYVPRSRDVTVDNAAVAWSQCTSCGGTALSVQVVVLDRGRRISADNRALATNAGCTGCTTAALAYQLVVVSPGAARLSRADLQDLRAWVAAQAAALRGPAAPLSRRSLARAQRAGGTLAGLVNARLHSRTHSLDVERR